MSETTAYGSGLASRWRIGCQKRESCCCMYCGKEAYQKSILGQYSCEHFMLTCDQSIAAKAGIAISAGHWMLVPDCEMVRKDASCMNFCPIFTQMFTAF